MTVQEVLSDSARSGAPIRFTAEVCARIVAIACQRPSDYGLASDRFSIRELRIVLLDEKVVETISERQVRRILSEAQIRPHKSRYWLYPKDSQELREPIIKAICEVYRLAPERYQKGEITLSVDEMCGIQALERIAPDAPPEPSEQAHEKRTNAKSCWRHEHEYIRHGTRSLLASWDVVKGKAFGWCNPTRTEDDFVTFMGKVEKQYPQFKRLHIVVDNLNTHKSAALVRWVAKRAGIDAQSLGVKGKRGILRSMKSRAAFLSNPEHPVVFHFTPRHCSWMNQIEIWFSILVRKLLKTASFSSVEQLENRITQFIEYFNRTMAKPFKWMFQGFDATAKS